MYSKLITYIKERLKEASEIPQERKQALAKIADFINDKKRNDNQVNLIFICTHNSRRSHFGQVWTSAGANYFKVNNINTFSGGTEATAFNPRAVAALERAGFKIDNSGGNNPRYKVFFSEEDPYLECFSKTFDDPANPKEDFIAIMTCSDADENCPFIPGASLRIPITYKDPKEADGSPEEKEVYDERCKLIAREMLFLMSQIKSF